MFRQGTHNGDGTWTMPKEKVERWLRQANTCYLDLPEHEKGPDRELADEITSAIEKHGKHPVQ